MVCWNQISLVLGQSRVLLLRFDSISLTLPLVARLRRMKFPSGLLASTLVAVNFSTHKMRILYDLRGDWQSPPPSQSL
jgi:hypothetical protein